MTPALALAPVVATYHTYSHHLLPHAVAWLWGASRNMNRLRVRIAVSEAGGVDGPALLRRRVPGSCPTA